MKKREIFEIINNFSEYTKKFQNFHIVFHPYPQ